MIMAVLPGYSQDAERILSDATIFGTADTAVITAELNIEKGIRRQSRTAEIFTEENGKGTRKIFAQIIDPPFLSNMRFLVLQRGPDPADTDRWIATSLGVRKVKGESTGETLFNSDFTLEELSGFVGTDYDARYVGRETVDGYETNVIRASVEGSGAGYDSFVLRTDRVTKIIVWIEFFQQDELIKEYMLVETDMQDDIIYTKKCRMITVRGNGKTELTVQSISFPDDIPDERFDETSLK